MRATRTIGRERHTTSHMARAVACDVTTDGMKLLERERGNNG
ncbi:MAG: hypothetical protein SPH31_08520 [Arcanobacterium sp.]|nr:hypothetical protein [Arcanobacterium sp.]